MLKHSVARHAILPPRQIPICVYHLHHRNLSSKTPASIAVIGGGIAGLSVTYFLTKLVPSAKITLFEETGKPGGWVSSKTVKTADDKHVLFEEGPRSLRPAGLPGLNVLDLIRQLGIEDKMILVPKTAPSAKNRFIYYAGQVHKLPSSIIEFLYFALTNPILKGSLSSLMKEPFRKRPKNITDETIASFISRRFSPIMAQNMLSAVIHGIYSGSIDKLSVRSTLKSLWEYESSAGSVVAGLLRGVDTRSVQDQELQKALQDKNSDIVVKMRDVSVYSFVDGLSTLTNALVTHLESLPNVTMKATSCRSVVRDADESFQITAGTDSSSASAFDQVISAVRAKDISRILGKGHDLTELDTVPYSTVMVINFHYRDPAILPITGFGYLIPKSVPLAENPDRALGVVFDSSSVPGQDTTGGTKVTCIMGGHWWEGQSIPTEREGYEATKRVMKMHLGIDQEPDFWNAKIQVDCIPQYTVGHIDRMKRLHDKLEKNWSGLGLIGSSYGGVSLNDCVLNARKIAMEIAARGQATGLEDFKTVE